MRSSTLSTRYTPLRLAKASISRSRFFALWNCERVAPPQSISSCCSLRQVKRSVGVAGGNPGQEQRQPGRHTFIKSEASIALASGFNRAIALIAAAIKLASSAGIICAIASKSKTRRTSSRAR